MTEPLRTDGSEVLAEHIATCRPDIDVTIVAHRPDESLDDVVQQMIDAGWTLSDQVEYVAGKRIRTMLAPGVEEDQLTAEIHEAWEHQMDECQHGNYRGGPSNGEPYEMCRIFARRILARRARKTPPTQEPPSV